MAFAAMCCVQLGAAASVGLFDRIGPDGAGWLRLLWAGIVLPLAIRPWRTRFTRSALFTCIALGISIAGTTMLFLAAAARLPLGTASALQFLGPLTVAIASGRATARLWALVAAAGVVLLTEPWRSGTDPSGVALALGAAACWGGYIVLAQRAGDEVTGVRALSISMPVAAVAATLAAGPGVIAEIGWQLLAIGLGLALLMPIVPYCLELLALRRLTLAAFGTLMSLEPAIALAIGLVALGQVPTAGGVAGVILVVVAGIGAERTGSRREH